MKREEVERRWRDPRRHSMEPPSESDRRIFRRLNLCDVNDCDECNELDRQKTRFASISIYTLLPHAPAIFSTAFSIVGLSLPLAFLIFYALYAPARMPFHDDGIFPRFDIAYNVSGYYEYYSIKRGLS